MRIPRLNTCRRESIRNRLGVEAETLTDRLQRQSIGVELDRETHLGSAHLARSHRDSRSVQDGAHRGAVQAKLTSDVIHSLAFLVCRDNFRLAFVIEVTLGLDAWPIGHGGLVGVVWHPGNRGQEVTPFLRVMSREVHNNKRPGSPGLFCISARRRRPAPPH